MNRDNNITPINKVKLPPEAFSVNVLRYLANLNNHIDTKYDLDNLFKIYYYSIYAKRKTLYHIANGLIEILKTPSKETIEDISGETDFVGALIIRFTESTILKEETNLQTNLMLSAIHRFYERARLEYHLSKLIPHESGDKYRINVTLYQSDIYRDNEFVYYEGDIVQNIPIYKKEDLYNDSLYNEEKKYSSDYKGAIIKFETQYYEKNDKKFCSFSADKIKHASNIIADFLFKDDGYILLPSYILIRSVLGENRIYNQFNYVKEIIQAAYLLDNSSIDEVKRYFSSSPYRVDQDLIKEAYKDISQYIPQSLPIAFAAPAIELYLLLLKGNNHDEHVSSNITIMQS